MQGRSEAGAPGTALDSAPLPGRNPALEAAGRCWGGPGASRADQGRHSQAQARLTVSSPALLHAACPEAGDHPTWATWHRRCSEAEAGAPCPDLTQG